MTTIRELAAGTPETRLRHVDALRALAMVAVVLGHWLVIAVHHDAAGNLTGYTALASLSWLYPLTWVFQVMPVFFLVGGIANAISWTRHRDTGGTAARWLLDRSGRLLPPVTAFLLVISVGALAAGWAGVPSALTAEAVHLVTMPLWFLVVYLGVIALTPLTYRLHTRFGLLVPALLMAGVALGDGLHLATSNDVWAFGNFLFAWLAVHQLGFAWQDASLRLTPRRALVLLAVAGATLLLLTGPGPYPVSMVSVPGAAVQNASPPTLALMALAAAQVAAIALVAPAAERLLQRRRLWTAVIAINAVMLTLYLWHMVAALIGVLVLDALGWLPAATADQGAFWLGRIPWLGMLLVAQAALIAVFGRIESGRLSRRVGRPPVDLMPERGLDESPGEPGIRSRSAGRVFATLPLVSGAYLAAIVGTFQLASAGPGPHGPLVIPTWSVVLLLAAAIVLRTGRSGQDPMERGRRAPAGTLTSAATAGVPVDLSG